MVVLPLVPVTPSTTILLLGKSFHALMRRPLARWESGTCTQQMPFSRASSLTGVSATIAAAPAAMAPGMALWPSNLVPFTAM